MRMKLDILVLGCGIACCRNCHVYLSADLVLIQALDTSEGATS